MQLELAGAKPVPDADVNHASVNIREFVEAVKALGDDVVVEEPERDRDSDEGGRFGFRLSSPGGTSVRILMPGVPLDVVCKVPGEEVPCLAVDGRWWWWRSAALQVRAVLRETSAHPAG